MHTRARQLYSFITLIALLGTSTPAVAATTKAPAHPTAKVIMQQMLTKIASSTTSHLSGAVTNTNTETFLSKGKKTHSTTSEVQIGLDALTDSTNPAQPLSYATMSIQSNNGNVTDEGFDYGVFKYIRNGSQSVYYNYQPSPVAKNYLSAFVGSDYVSFFDQNVIGHWVGFDKASLNAINSMLGADLVEDSYLTSASKIQQNSSITPAQFKKAIDVVKKSTAVVPVYRGLEKVGGVPAYHIQLVVQKTALLKLITDLNKALGMPSFTQLQRLKLVASINLLSVPQVHVWVGASDFLPQRITIKTVSTQKSSFSITQETTSIDVSLDSFYGIDSPIVIPSDAAKFEEIIAKFQAFEAERNSTTNPYGRDKRRLADLKMLQTGLEMFIDDHDAYPKGENIMLGSADAACLNDDGWQKTNCYNPYMSEVPGDAFGGTFMYTSSASNTYSISAQLEGVVSDLSGNITLSPGGFAKAASSSAF